MEEVMTAFRQAVGLYAGRRADAPEAFVTMDGEELSMAQMARLAAGLHQPLPGDVCSELELPSGSSYARGARRLLELLERDGRSAPAAP